MQPKTFQEAGRFIARKLADAHLDQNEADLFLSAILDLPIEKIIQNPHSPFTKEHLAQAEEMLLSRKQGKPFAYLVGYKFFYGKKFFVTPDVLIPRPETELLIDLAKQCFLPDATKNFADVGTGSGCVAVTLAREFPNAHIVATDISEKALLIAQKNATFHNLSDRITFLKQNLLGPFPPAHIDAIFANLPYLTNEETSRLPHEPANALDGGKNGFVIIAKLITQIAAYQIPRAFLEFSPTQTEEALTFMNAYPEYSCKIMKDNAGKDRIISLEKR